MTISNPKFKVTKPRVITAKLAKIIDIKGKNPIEQRSASYYLHYFIYFIYFIYIIFNL